MALITFDEFLNRHIGKAMDYDKVAQEQCFTANHYVLMADMTYKAIQDIEIGDKVIGYDNKINTVIQTHKRKAEVIKVRTDLGDIVVTENHPFYFKDGSFGSILEGSKKPFGIFDKTNYEESGLTDNELLFLGFWLGDGSLGRHKDNRNDEIRITYGTSKKSFVESLGIATNIQPHSSANGSYNAGIRKRDHPLLTQIIYSCYNANKEKVLPLIFTNREYGLIIDGYIKADGSECNNSFSISSTSKSLLLSIQAAAILCGYVTESIRPVTRGNKPIIINGKTVKSVKPIWRMTICKGSLKTHKQIYSVDYIGEDTVYNIGVDGSHTYICDNYKVHNCVDLIKYYLKEVFGIESGAWGDAHCYYDNFKNIPNLYNNFIRIPNTPDFVPQRGDIAVWGTGLNGKWGHIAICDGDGDTSQFYSYDQNWTGRNDVCTRIHHNYNYFLGVLRPKDQTRIKGKGKEDNTMNVFSKGIDIHGGYQTSVDFKRVKASGIDYVILHAGYGDTLSYPNQKDPKFEEYYKAAKTAGLDVGIYWYSYAQSVEAARREAQSCIEMLKGKKFEYPIYFDMEEKSQYNKGKAFCDSIVTAFCDTLNKAGYYSGLYCSTYYLNDRVSPAVAKKYALWVAQYNTKCTYTGAPYGMWQYSSTGHVDSISGTVDMDYCYVNYPKIIKEAGKNGYTKPADLPILDKTGYKKGDKGYEALALKTLLKLAVDKGLVGGKLDDTTGLGAGSIKIVNALLTKWKYKSNGIAGKNFINKLYKKLK